MTITDASEILLGKSEVRFTDNVKLLSVNIPFIVVMGVMRDTLARFGLQPVITSAADYDETRKLPYHAKGYAWDYRSHDLSNPAVVAAIVSQVLHSIDSRYRVLYHHGSTGFHFHIEYRFDEPVQTP